jgi:hypothetical protein
MTAFIDSDARIVIEPRLLQVRTAICSGAIMTPEQRGGVISRGGFFFNRCARSIAAPAVRSSCPFSRTYAGKHWPRAKNLYAEVSGARVCDRDFYVYVYDAPIRTDRGTCVYRDV